jgi:nucleotide-binding universal stress UspA family protein
MKTLVVPTDFSPVAVNAINYAADMALAINCSIVLVNTYQAPVIYSDSPIPPVAIDSFEEIQKASEERLEEQKRVLMRTTAGKIKIYTESRFGDVVSELEKLCNSIDPFAIIMGSNGAAGLERLLMGSTTLKTISHIKYPVIVVPPGTSYKGIRKIGLACDYKNIIESTPVEFIKNIVNEFGAELHVLNIDHNDSHQNKDAIVESAWLEALLDNIKPNYYFLDREDVVEGINEFAETGNLDMVMVIPKKHNLIEGLFHKSKSKELITHSHIPIVSIHE